MPIVIQIWKNIKLFKIDFKITLNGNTVDLISILPQHFDFSLHLAKRRCYLLNIAAIY